MAKDSQGGPRPLTAPDATSQRLIQPKDRFEGAAVTLRLVTLADCTPEYVGWLNDPEVSRYLETRWLHQSLESIREFVAQQLAAEGTYLFAILVSGPGRHVGNLKIGPIDTNHLSAYVSYFIGDRSVWGRGYATDALRVAARISFGVLGLHKIQAGVYASNRSSQRALERAGFRPEGRWQRQLRGPNGWEDHLFYGLLREEWEEPGAGPPE